MLTTALARDRRRPNDPPALQACSSVQFTPFLPLKGYTSCLCQGGIHPRLKRPVGRRLAVAAVALLHRATTPPAEGGALTGPTIAGCSLSGAAPHHGEVKDRSSVLTLQFDLRLLGEDEVLVQDFNTNMSSWHGVDSLTAMVCASASCPNLRRRVVGGEW